MMTIYPSRCVFQRPFAPSTRRLDGVEGDEQSRAQVEDQVDEVDEWNRRARTVVFAP